MANKFEITDDVEGVELFVAPLFTVPLYLPDNKVALCCKCFRSVQHRPDPVIAGLKKICIECAAPFMNESVKCGTLDLRTTTKHAKEFRDWLRRKEN